MAKRFSDKVVIVVGSGWGIGAQIVRQFAEEGAQVIAAGLTKSKLDNVVAEVVEKGFTAEAYQIDVCDPAAIKEMAKYVYERYGRIDILCNNAQRNHIAPLQYLSLEDWDDTLRVTLTASMLAMQAVYPYMKERGGGSIINTGSGAGYLGDRKFAAYCAAKAAVHNLTRAAAVDFAPARIRVNCICPGVTLTPAIVAAFPGEDGNIDPIMKAKIDELHLTGRMCESSDIANGVLFLASEEAANINGFILRVEGGLTAYSNCMPERDI